MEYGGFARVTAAIQSLAGASRNVLKIHAGDAVTGDLYFNLSNGKADAEMMNTVCFDSFTLGNHEFDNTDSGLKTFINYLHAGSRKTPVLSANVKFASSSALAGGPVKASTVVERDGQKIGIVGLTIADKTKNSSRPMPAPPSTTKRWRPVPRSTACAPRASTRSWWPRTSATPASWHWPSSSAAWT